MKLKVLLLAGVLFLLSFGVVSAQVSNTEAPNTAAVVQNCLNSGGTPQACAEAGAAYLRGLGYTAGVNCSRGTACIVTCSNGGSVSIPIPTSPPPLVNCPSSTHKCGPASAGGTICNGKPSPGDLTGSDNTSCGKQMYCWYCPPPVPTATPIPPTATPTMPPPVPTPPSPTPVVPTPTTPPPVTPTATPPTATPPTRTPPTSVPPTSVPPTSVPPSPTPTATATPSPTPPFDEAMCKCDSLDFTSIALGMTTNITAYGKVTGTDTKYAKIPSMTFKFFQGNGTVVNEIQKATINTTVVEQSNSLVKYQAVWALNLPTSLDTTQTYRIQAKPDCSRKAVMLNASPTTVVLAASDSQPTVSFWGRISSFFSGLFGGGTSGKVNTAVPASVSPTMTQQQKRQLQLKTFTPATGISTDNCSFIKFNF